MEGAIAIRRSVGALLLVLAVAGAGPALAQEPPAAVPRPSVTLQADALYDAGEFIPSLSLLEGYLERTPDDYGAQWRAARACLALALQVDDRKEERDPLLERGVAFGEAAVRLQPGGSEGLMWRLANKGRLGLRQGPFRALDLAKQIHAESTRLIELDPTNAGAHDALGRLKLEILTLAGWQRLFARRFAGAAIKEATWALAEEHLERAVELDPDRVLYRRDLGHLYARRSDPRARAMLERALALPSREPGDELFKREARELLRWLPEAADGSDPGPTR